MRILSPTINRVVSAVIGLSIALYFSATNYAHAELSTEELERAEACALALTIKGKQVTKSHTSEMDLFPNDPSVTLEQIVAAVQTKIRNWIRIADSEAQSFARTGFFEIDRPNKPQGKVLTLRHNDIWAIAFEHNDAKTRSRQWRADIVIEKTADHVVVRTNISTLDPPGTQITTPHSAPAIVQDLLNPTSRVPWTSSVGVLPIKSDLTYVGEKDIEPFLTLLSDTARSLPVVFVSLNNRTARAAIDPKALAHNLRGSAIVVAAESVNAIRLLEEAIPSGLRAFNGAVRVYMPDFSFDTRFNHSAHHPYVTGEQAMRVGVTGLTEMIRKIISKKQTQKAGTPKSPSGIVSIHELVQKARAEAVAIPEQKEVIVTQIEPQPNITALVTTESAATEQSAFHSEYIQTLEAVNTQLEIDQRELKDQLQKTKEDLEFANLTIEELRAQVAALESEAAILRNSVATLPRPSAPTQKSIEPAKVTAPVLKGATHFDVPGVENPQMRIYVADGASGFEKWVDELGIEIRKSVWNRLAKVSENSHFGDANAVKLSPRESPVTIFEMRFMKSSGPRIYYMRHENYVIVLGYGLKTSGNSGQANDIYRSASAATNFVNSQK